MDQAIDLLTSHSREDAITTKLIQPPWFRASEILLYCLFIISAVTAALKLQFDTFSCNVVECIYNETLTTIQTCPRFQTRSLDADATYNFIDDKCRDQMIPFVLENIPFIYFIIATILLSCSSLWLKLPSSALYIERFVGFVKECNEAIETHGSVYWEYVSDTSLPAYRQQNRVVQFLITCFCCRNRVSPDNVREKSSSTGSCQNGSDLEPIQKLSKLHDKFVHMVKPQKRKIHVCVILILQQVLLTGLSLVFFLCVSCTFFWFDFLRNEYICVLEEYSRIACHYRLYATYYFFAVIFCFCNCFHCFLSCVHLCWVIRHSFTPIDISRDPKGRKRYVSGQLGLMLHLLTTNDTYFVSRVQFFMNDKTKAPVTYEEKELMYSEENLERINNKKGQLRLQNLQFRPRSFDSLHRIPNLTVLGLTNCNLTEFPFCILLSKSLMKVDLSDNKIEIIPRLTGEVKDRTGLNSLVLDENHLLPISMINLSTWTKLKILSIVNTMGKKELKFS
ncbi:uncharacterized protein LOC110465106 [Mizuhopecten yessoensis]|uniref:uncharacterized protein LOC110465106 n=1 Tax=Mizuhopecten yessoensis TaxID=6573 RepID=UPI000B45D66D|nr:uncharacterized protein LOC110465106 [Mizuhopecten yessoensis]